MPNLLTTSQGAKQTGQDWRDHWMTPPHIIAAVNEFYGGNWFDPCPPSPSFDGLTVGWGPKSYINPPFSKYKKWFEYGRAQKGEQLWLSNNFTDTIAGQTLLKICDAVLFFKKRLAFLHPETREPSKNNNTGQMLCYFGPNSLEFNKVFSQFGIVLEPVK
jgi:hypothetical protein